MSSRTSMHPNANYTTMTYLTNCIASVDFACRTLEGSNAQLVEQTQDMSRIAKILRSKRHFDLVSEQEIRTARNHLSAEIAPQLKELILRAEEALQRDERRAKVLKGKVTQQGIRLEQLAQLHEVSVDELRQSALRKPDVGQADEVGEAKGRDEDRQARSRQAEEIKRLRDEAEALQAKRVTMQRELARLEQEARPVRTKNK